jgi:hypothetical protein
VDSILSLALTLLSQAAWRRVTRGSLAGLVALLLICGMGGTRVTFAAHATDSVHDDLTVIVQSDTSIDDVALAAPAGGDGPDDDMPFYGTSVVLAAANGRSLPAEDQVAFGLCRSTIARALHPTGPPLLS